MREMLEFKRIFLECIVDQSQQSCLATSVLSNQDRESGVYSSPLEVVTKTLELFITETETREWFIAHPNKALVFFVLDDSAAQDLFAIW